MVKISKIRAREILDSRGNPTIEVHAATKDKWAIAKVPSGASTGIHEALELRDKGKRYNGKGVLKAIKNVNNIIGPKIKGMEVDDQVGIDARMLFLDGTNNKKKLGANAMLGVSMAVTRLAAMEKNIPLYQYLAEFAHTEKKMCMPMPFANVLNGGKHAGNELAMQEFMVVPVKAKSFTEATQVVSEIYHTLKEVIEKGYGKQAVNVGDEGGFAPPVRTAYESLDLLNRALDFSGYKNKVKFAIDAAASEFFHKGLYHIDRDCTPAKMIEYYLTLLDSYPIISLEDPFDQDDFKSFRILLQELKYIRNKDVQIVGDDLTVSNLSRIQTAVMDKLCNALLLKVNQIGTVTEAVSSAKYAMAHDWKVMVSHRSGETTDDFIADLAVALGCGQAKIGAPCRGERTAKYNRLMAIEDMTNGKLKYGVK